MSKRCYLKKLGQLVHSRIGFSLLEVLVAVGILGFIGVTIVQALDTGYRSARTLDEKVTARTLISAHMENIKQLPYSANYPSASENITIPQQYSVIVSTECTDDDVTYQTCTGNETLQRIIVSVLREGRPVLRICTFRTPRYE
jgi:type II secretory pathway pseudopilin PulG